MWALGFMCKMFEIWHSCPRPYTLTTVIYEYGEISNLILQQIIAWNAANSRKVMAIACCLENPNLKELVYTSVISEDRFRPCLVLIGHCINFEQIEF